ncbi:MAG: hypothetical protein ABSG74_04215 [Candidatus Bathyarchaeia archaeon]|jgi:hypothetical protein
MSVGLRNWLRRAPWRIRRSLGNVAYRLRLVRAPGAAGLKGSWMILFLATICIAAFFLAGGIYDLLEKPVSLLPTSTSQGWTFIYPNGLGAQTLNESILAGMLYLIGLSGFYMLYRSTRFAYRPRNAYILLIIGFLTTVIVIYYTGQLLAQKGA